MRKNKGETSFGIRRREFLGVTVAAPVIILGAGCADTTDGLALEQTGFIGGLKKVSGAC